MSFKRAHYLDACSDCILLNRRLGKQAENSPLIFADVLPPDYQYNNNLSSFTECESHEADLGSIVLISDRLCL